MKIPWDPSISRGNTSLELTSGPLTWIRTLVALKFGGKSRYSETCFHPPLFKRWAILVIIDFVVEKSSFYGGLGVHQCTRKALSRRDVLTQSFACTLGAVGASEDELGICQVAVVLLMVQTSGQPVFGLLVEIPVYTGFFYTSKRWFSRRISEKINRYDFWLMTVIWNTEFLQVMTTRNRRWGCKLMPMLSYTKVDDVLKRPTNLKYEPKL